LASPAVLGSSISTFGTVQCEVPAFIPRILVQFSHFTRGTERHSFSSDLRTLDDVLTYVRNLKLEVDGLIKDGHQNSFKYFVPYLANNEAYEFQMRCVSNELERYASCTSIGDLVNCIAVTLNRIRIQGDLSTDNKSLSDIYSQLSKTPDNAVYGIRKYIPISKTRVAFVGDPSPFYLALSKLFVSSIHASFDDGTSVQVNAPILGCNVVVVEELTQGQWLLNLLNFRKPVDKVASVTDVKQASERVVASVGAPRSTTTFGKLGNARVSSQHNLTGSRGYHSSAVRDEELVQPRYLYVMHTDGRFERIVRLT